MIGRLVHSTGIFSLICSAIILAPACHADPTAIEGEYVISSVAPVAQLQQKALETLQTLTNDPLGVVDGEGTLMLVADVSKDEINQTGPDNEVDLEDVTLCKELRKRLRQMRIERKDSGTNTIIRSMVCEPNGVFKASLVPNDPYFSTLWGMNQSNDIDLNAPEAWDGGTDCSSQVVAIIDTGIQYDHPDLSANMWVNPNERVNGIDDDGNGVVDDIYGYNTITGSGDPRDDNGHGTHCAERRAATPEPLCQRDGRRDQSPAHRGRHNRCLSA